MRSMPLILLLSLLLSSCGQPTTSTSVADTGTVDTAAVVLSESERLNLWFDEKYEEALLRSPIALTRLGRKERYDEMDDVSEAELEAQLQMQAEAVAELQANFDYDALTQDAKVSYDLWVSQYQTARSLAPYRRHGYIFQQQNGIHTFLPTFLITLHTVANDSEMQAYISRIGGIARMIDQLVERAKLGAAEGVRPPRFSYEIVLQEAQALITGAPFDAQSDIDSPLLADAKAKIKTLLDAGDFNEDMAVDLLSQAEAALLGSFEPSYQALIQWLEADYANTDEQARGVGALPDGEAYYSALLASSTTTDLTAEQIHALGLSEVARIKEEMEALKDSVAFNGTLSDFFTFIKTDQRFLFPNNDEGRQAYLDESTRFIADMRRKIPDYFGRLPKAELDVKRVEAFREQDGAAQHYRAGTPDGSRNGTYYAHLSDMNSMPQYDMEAVAYHEGIPGHHMQISIALELEDVPEFRKTVSFTSFIEGWALYAEKLAREMGGYEDPYKDFGRLNAEIWRAIRLVVDTGIHAQGWTEQQAVDYFLANSSLSEGQIRSEVRRYITTPAQATTYKIGMLKFLELREKATNELGDDFDIRAFHDIVLGGGALPLTLLEQVVDHWIAEH